MSGNIGRTESREARALFLIYRREANSFPTLSGEEERILAKRIHDHSDKKARDIFVAHNLRLVMWVANEFAWSGIEFADLVQAGNERLFEAIDEFKPSLGCRFSTFAVRIIRQGMVRALDRHLPLFVPTTKMGDFRKARRAQRKLGAGATLAELAKETSCSPTAIHTSLLAANIKTVSLEEKPQTAENRRRRERDQTCGHDVVPDNSSLGPTHVIELRAELNDARESVSRVFADAKRVICRIPKHLDVFYTAYDLDESGTIRSFSDVARIFSRHRQQVYSIIERFWQCLGKLGCPITSHEQFVEVLERAKRIENLLAENGFCHN